MPPPYEQYGRAHDLILLAARGDGAIDERTRMELTITGLCTGIAVMVIVSIVCGVSWYYKWKLFREAETRMADDQKRIATLKTMLDLTHTRLTLQENLHGPIPASVVAAAMRNPDSYGIRSTERPLRVIRVRPPAAPQGSSTIGRVREDDELFAVGRDSDDSDRGSLRMSARVSDPVDRGAEEFGACTIDEEDICLPTQTTQQQQQQQQQQKQHRRSVSPLSDYSRDPDVQELGRIDAAREAAEKELAAVEQAWAEEEENPTLEESKATRYKAQLKEHEDELKGTLTTLDARTARLRMSLNDRYPLNPSAVSDSSDDDGDGDANPDAGVEGSGSTVADDGTRGKTRVKEVEQGSQ
ncbi:hypothetical protein C8035_v006408 [Colletotrichum spinosum]|uniref:Uncharacterized protein n=1 Tax=Colletotrichum spinosum TaxID=1347390 RepID=A0A4R8QRG1_9PEZI|nr:hypothetical protein C8035_v006408 [Colletotrichum spinosum]